MSLNFSELGSTEKQQKWEWDRTSKNVAAVKAIEANYLQTVKMSKRIGTPKERGAQEEENTWTMKLLDTCENHHGPVTQESILFRSKKTKKQKRWNLNKIIFITSIITITDRLQAVIVRVLIDQPY